MASLAYLHAFDFHTQHEFIKQSDILSSNNPTNLIQKRHLSKQIEHSNLGIYISIWFTYPEIQNG